MEEYNLWSLLMQQFRESCSEFDHLWMKRRRLFDTERLVRGLLHLVGGSQKSYSQVLDQFEGEAIVSAAPSSFCEARSKLPSFIVGDIRRNVLDVWDEQVDQELWHGFNIYAVDGSKVSLPRTLFKEGFKAPVGGHCPQGLVSLMLRLNDRMVFDIRFSSNENERDHALEHLAHLTHKDLVVYDRGYLSFILLNAHVAQGINAVFRVAKGSSFLPFQKFWSSRKFEKIVTINPTSVTYCNAQKKYEDHDLKPIKLRLIKYKIEGETYVLATTVLDGRIKREAFVSLYSDRWFSEETFKSFKQTLDLEVFHAQTLNGVEQEVEARALFWNLARSLGKLAEPLIKKKLENSLIRLTIDSASSRYRVV